MMRVLVIASINNGVFAPFVLEQAEALRKSGCEIELYGITGKSMSGYLGNFSTLKRKIHEFQPQVIHAHYGLSGLLANLQREVPVVTTFHGSDINDSKVIRFSRTAMRLSVWNIFVSRGLMEKARANKRSSLIPCGIDVDDYPLVDKIEARKKMGLDPGGKYVLFAGAFDIEVKNAPLARQAVERLDAELLELKGFNREEVNLMLCAADVMLLTSLAEGSPQVIKEAMACGCPIVSVDVGDVQERLRGLEGCYVARTREPQELYECLRKAMSYEGRTEGRNRIMADGLDNRIIAQHIIEIYERVGLHGTH